MTLFGTHKESGNQYIMHVFSLFEGGNFMRMRKSIHIQIPGTHFI